LEDDDVEVTRSLDSDGDSFYGGASSHVLLAACAKDQQAREKEKRGLFTQELVRLLREGDFDRQTYDGLIWRFKELAK
jgi:hypothetical protein